MSFLHPERHIIIFSQISGNNHKSRAKLTKKKKQKIGVKFLVKNHKSREKITILNPPKTGSISSEKNIK